MRHWGSLILAVMCLALPLSACGLRAGKPAPTGSNRPMNLVGGVSRLSTVLDRGQLVCGVSGELPGFSFVNREGEYTGLDVDICRAIAAALFDDPNAVEFRNLNAKERFTALQTGEIDILSRNTTWTLSRDASVGLDFAPTVFYDGQGIMVRAASGIKTLEALRNKAVCTQTGTTNEQNLADQMRKRGIDYQLIVFEDINAAYAAYVEGRCAGVSSDRSQLISRKSALPDPDSHYVLPEVLSKEPLAPAVAGGDSQWADVVRWSIFALIEAEELGITSQNWEQLQTGDDPEIKRFLGVEGDLGQGLGLSNDFAARIVKHVGNYGEMYDRNLGPKTPLNLDRGLNQLWEQGGLMYAPPLR